MERIFNTVCTETHQPTADYIINMNYTQHLQYQLHIYLPVSGATSSTDGNGIGLAADVDGRGSTVTVNTVLATTKLFSSSFIFTSTMAGWACRSPAGGG